VPGYEAFDIIAWRPYLAAFDEYLATGSRAARQRMRVELQERLDEEGVTLGERDAGGFKRVA
jgi:hypothetical protein